MPYKAAAIDLDGTLLDRHKRIGPRSLLALQSAAQAGWTLIISTARPVRAIREFLPESFTSYYWASCNGAWILQGGQVLRRVEIPNQAALSLAQELSRAGLRVLIEANDQIFTDGEMPPEFIGEVIPIAELGSQDACKVLVHLRSPEETGLVLRSMPGTCQCVFTDGGKLAQISARGCDKLNAVHWILAREGIPLAETVAFGDDANDQALLTAAGCGVAMGNAAPEVRAAASHHTCSNDEDGVGIFLERLLDP